MARKPKDADKTANVDPNDIADCAAEYELLMGQRSRIDAKIAHCFDRFEKKGVTRAPIKRAYKRRNMTADEVRAELAEDTLYARVLGHIEWDKQGQASFTKAMSVEIARPNGDAASRLAGARAYNDGYNTALHGGLIGSCKHQTGSEEFVRWRDGWQDGSEARAETKPEATNGDAAKPKRGRPRKDQATASTEAEAPAVH